MTQTRSKGSILLCSLGLVLFLCGFSSCASNDSQDYINFLIIYPKNLKCGDPEYVDFFILTSYDVSSIKYDNDSAFSSKLVPFKNDSKYKVILNGVPHYTIYPSTPREGNIGTSLDSVQSWDISPCDVHLLGEHLLSLDYKLIDPENKILEGSLVAKGIVVDQNRNYYFSSLFEYILKNQLQAVITLLIAIAGFVSGLVFRKSPSKDEKDD